MNIETKDFLKGMTHFIFYCFLVLMLFLAGSQVEAKNKDKNKVTLQGEVSTGANILLGEPIFTFPDPWGQIAIPVIGEYNPAGLDPFPLTSSTPGNAILASRVADFLQVLFPLASPHNVPLHEVLTSIDGNLTIGAAPDIADAGINEASSNRQPVTLDDWLQAEGNIKIKCKSEGDNQLKMKVSGLIPGALYTLWQTRGTPSGGLAAVPAGGFPNVIVPDSEGNAKYGRNMQHCPVNQGDVDEPVLMYELALHSDGRIHGAVPDLPEMGYPFGWGTHTQITFPVLLAED